MEGKAVLALLGVACLLAPRAAGDVGAPMAAPETGIATPEVVVQLKYEQGALNRIYLTQFRAAPGAAPGAAPDAVPAASQLCADLCHAGLGGESCGASCTDMMPVGLASALRSVNQSSAQYGEPRVGVCPVLCANGLGSPLCNCPAERADAAAADYAAVCDAFCSTDGYVLGGCPVCKKISIPAAPAALADGRSLNTSEGWVVWCNAQCRQGHGGAACNCDRAPFQ